MNSEYIEYLSALLAELEGDLLLLVGGVDALLVDVIDQRVTVEAARRLLLAPVRRPHRRLHGKDEIFQCIGRKCTPRMPDSFY